MKIFLRDQRHQLAGYLPAFRHQPLSYADTARFRQKETSVPIPLAEPPPPLDKCRWDFLFHYDIFPARLLIFAADWQPAGRPMQAGDVIVQQAYVPPGPLSAKLVFAVRVLAVEHTPERVGFRYGTLRGHAERGESAFYIERSAAGLRAVIRTQSAPGLWASRLAAPFFTYPYQQYCTDQAVRQMRARFLAAQAGSAGPLAPPVL